MLKELPKNEWLSLLFVFDNPWLGNHLLLTDTERQKRRHQGAIHDLTFSLVE